MFSSITVSTLACTTCTNADTSSICSTVFGARFVSNTDHSVTTPLAVTSRTVSCTCCTDTAIIASPSSWANTCRNTGTHHAIFIGGAYFSCTRGWSITRWTRVAENTLTCRSVTGHGAKLVVSALFVRTCKSQGAR